MRTTLTGATTLALAIALTPATMAQTRNEQQPGQQQPGQQQPGQQGQVGQENLTGQDGEQRQQQTVRGRITAIEMGDRAGQPGQDTQAERPGQAGQTDRQAPDAEKNRAIITVDSRSMQEDPTFGQREAQVDRPALRNRDDQPGSTPDPREGRENQPQDRPTPGDDPVNLGQRNAGAMSSYQFVATEETLVEADEASDQPGQSGASDRPNPGQQSNQRGQQVPAARPGQDGQSIEAGQPAQQEYRGLRIGQYVEVTYRPMPNQDRNNADQPNQPNLNDQPREGQDQNDQPRVGQDPQQRAREGQAGQDPTGRRPGQANQADQARMIRGQAISIRVIPSPDLEEGLDRPVTPERNRPGLGGENQDRPTPGNQGQDNDTNRPNPIP